MTTIHPLINEVVAVDDGSTDHTARVIAKFERARLIMQKQNAGKSSAMCAGIRKSAGALLLFLDVDLIGLPADDITALLHPVLSGRADASISLRKDALLPWRTIDLDYLSAERVMSREVLAGHLEVIARLPGFSLETYLNDLLIRRDARIEIVRWPSVGHVYKARKYGFWNGMHGEARMLMNIMEITSLAGTAQQISALRKLRI